MIEANTVNTETPDAIDEIVKIVRHVTDHYEHEIAALGERIRALEGQPKTTIPLTDRIRKIEEQRDVDIETLTEVITDHRRRLERLECEPVENAKIVTNPDAPPRPASIWIEIPIAYVCEVSIGARLGAGIMLDTDVMPKAWDASYIPVDLPTAIRAAELLEAGRQTKEFTP